MRKAPDPVETRTAVLAISDYIRGEVDSCDRKALAAAVRLTARTVEHAAPGHTVELRVPPFVAVQCIEGPRHTRGTPPNVVELAPLHWLQVATGLKKLQDVAQEPGVEVSGTRALEVAHFLPIVPL
ncbi:sterol carrier family protein [Corynebacterium aquilae]|uniref:sterol carrier family protein n=1 Tax=Corynebacterium aquilae TaxID=203263 RepID=UPI000952A515|nr:sterol carrier family protein [Corynebacterium aquilae]